MGKLLCHVPNCPRTFVNERALRDHIGRSHSDLKIPLRLPGRPLEGRPVADRPDDVCGGVHQGNLRMRRSGDRVAGFGWGSVVQRLPSDWQEIRFGMRYWIPAGGHSHEFKCGKCGGITVRVCEKNGVPLAYPLSSHFQSNQNGDTIPCPQEGLDPCTGLPMVQAEETTSGLRQIWTSTVGRWSDSTGQTSVSTSSQ